MGVLCAGHLCQSFVIIFLAAGGGGINQTKPTTRFFVSTWRNQIDYLDHQSRTIQSKGG
jgi:hypothetical protein